MAGGLREHFHPSGLPALRPAPSRCIPTVNRQLPVICGATFIRTEPKESNRSVGVSTFQGYSINNIRYTPVSYISKTYAIQLSIFPAVNHRYNK